MMMAMIGDYDNDTDIFNWKIKKKMKKKKHSRNLSVALPWISHSNETKM